MDTAHIVDDWSARLKIAHELQEQERNGGAAPDAVLPNGLPACPVATTLSLISSRWSVLILRELLSGTKRFGELKRALTGISQKVLTSNLRSMEESGLLTRTIYPEVPPRVEYALTDLGFSLEPVIDSMWVWGSAYQQRRSESATGTR